MIITLIPRGQSIDEANPLPALHLERKGDTLIINGESFDFSVIPTGATLPDGQAATGCPFIAGDIECDDAGTLRISLVLPHAEGNAAPHEARFPQPIVDPADGLVPLPETVWPPPPPALDMLEPEQEVAHVQD
ncbi:MAG: hypothetical protein ABN482_01570 [Corticimicrobacter sp.]|uniref:hypothetical protein n=1 Tax=Corticimicrobacter sp. TaxID=2678536 RepID=UPI0032DAB341